MVDLSKPAFKLGIAEIEVGLASHRLKVEVTPDKASYPIRATSQVRVKVSLPDGRPAPAGTEVALAAVDEALLELMPNASWDLLKAMIRPRSYGVDTSTAQMQIIGKRHYGKKAAPAGGGGGQFPTRELFDTLLLWNPRVLLDANGEALVNVPLNDSLTSFRIVAVADVVQGTNAALFGTGRASIRATQDLQIASGVPPLVREGDRYRAMFTLRNTTAKAVEATLAAQVGAAALAPQKLRIEANGAAEAHWEVEVPYNVRQLEWTVSAEAAGARDRMKVMQAVREVIPVRVQQATLMQLDKTVALPVAPPASAVATAQGVLRGGIDVTLRPRLGDGLPGLREYFMRYPWSCMEQQASVALGLRDTERWRSIASRLPLYLDDDGLANYFPPAQGWRVTGSDTLTAYLLAASHEASRLGHDFSIPEETRSKMERGLIGFVEGRIKRDFWVPPLLRNGDLAVRKIAALEALSRSGKVRPRLLDSIQILPNQWPTGAVIDWLMILERVSEIPERDKRIAEAEQVLRARLNVQGTRLGFSTERDDSWWWLMVNGDGQRVGLARDGGFLQALRARAGERQRARRLRTRAGAADAGLGQGGGRRHAVARLAGGLRRRREQGRHDGEGEPRRQRQALAHVHQPGGGADQRAVFQRLPHQQDHHAGRTANARPLDPRRRDAGAPRTRRAGRHDLGGDRRPGAGRCRDARDRARPRRSHQPQRREAGRSRLARLRGAQLRGLPRLLPLPAQGKFQRRVHRAPEQRRQLRPAADARGGDVRAGDVRRAAEWDHAGVAVMQRAALTPALSQGEREQTEVRVTYFPLSPWELSMPHI
jgi:hypothetical protein